LGGLGNASKAAINVAETATNTWGASAATTGTTFPVPVVLPEVVIIAPLVLVPFAALCVIIGMHWSLKSKGTLGSVIWSVAIVSIIAGVVGLCAWNAGAKLPGLGPVVAGLSPMSAVFACVDPVEAMNTTVGGTGSGLGTARVALFIGAIIGAGASIGIVYAIRASMTRNFDMTVRKLAGSK
jgi:hypothetical protein